MVRSILLGLLSLAVIPVTLADTITISNTKVALSRQTKENHNINNRPCILLEQSTKTNCLSSKMSKVDNLEVYSELWFKNISELLLSGSMFSGCKTTRQKVLPTATKKFQDSGCIFSWQKSLKQEANISNKLNSITESNDLLVRTPPLRTSALPSAKVASGLNLARSSTKSAVLAQTPIKFPKLSRSSLIVSLPTADSTFIPQNAKLANPAPKTKRIASPFGWRKRPYSYQLQFHQGVDYGAPLGSPVVAVGDGIVTQVVSGCYDFGNLFCGGQLGNWIEIDHGNGILGIYGHLKNNSIAIEEGMKVWKNQKIAQVGSSGWSTGAHLDFRLKLNGEYKDPAKYLTPPKLVKTTQ